VKKEEEQKQNEGIREEAVGSEPTPKGRSG
jgi:hypothetical protein